MLRKLSLVLAVALATLGSSRAEVPQVRIGRAPGLAYLPLFVMEADKLLEKRLAQAGLGDVPVVWQNSTGGKTRLGGISKRGNQYLRRLLINGARQSATLKGDQCRPVGDGVAPATAEYGRSGSVGQQDCAHRLGGDAPAGELPARGCGSLGCQRYALELAREQ